MGRPKKKDSEKKPTVSVTISNDNYNQLVDGGVNKSQLINWLLEQHFGLVKS